MKLLFVLLPGIALGAFVAKSTGNDLTGVAIVVSILLAAFVYGVHRTRQLRDHGVRGTALVLHSTHIQTDSKGRAHYKVDFLVDLPGNSPYLLRVGASPLPASWTPNARIPVRVHPRDHTNFEFST